MVVVGLSSRFTMPPNLAYFVRQVMCTLYAQYSEKGKTPELEKEDQALSANSRMKICSSSSSGDLSAGRSRMWTSTMRGTRGGGS